MTTALIVEDEPLLRAAMREQLSSLWPELELKDVGDGVQAAQLLAHTAPDVLFLDIHVPGLDGLELAQLASGRSHVVFVTAFQEHAVQAFEKGAVDFLVKPVEAERMALAVSRLRQRVLRPPANLTQLLQALARGAPGRDTHIRWIQASTGNRIHVVPVSAVHYFQSDLKYTKVVTESETFHIRRSIKELVEQLDPETFWQLSRATIVNATRIESASKQGDQMEVRLKGSRERFAVSQPFQRRFRE